MAADILAVWIDGRLVEADARAGPSDRRAPRGCYTTARVAAGRVRWVERHVRRLRDDARRLGLGRVEEDACRSALAELAAAAFPRGEGIVRLDVTADGRSALRLEGRARALGADPEVWEALVAAPVHSGPSPCAGAKLVGEPAIEQARDAAREVHADEALLLDAAGRLVEGARSSVIVATSDGALVTPPLSRGGVAGLARGIALAALSDLVERDVAGRDLSSARELIAVNAVRGARAIVRLDGEPVAEGRPGPWSRRIADLLAASDGR